MRYVWLYMLVNVINILYKLLKVYNMCIVLLFCVGINRLSTKQKSLTGERVCGSSLVGNVGFAPNHTRRSNGKDMFAGKFASANFLKVRAYNRML